MREVFNAIRGNAICFPDRPAIVLPDEQITYRELWKKVLIVWSKIDDLGFDREKPVILHIDNPIRHTIVRFALMCAGYSVAAIRTEHLSSINVLRADVLISASAGINVAGIEVIQVDQSWMEGPVKPLKYHPYLKSNRIGRIVFTSGSTGTPKAIATCYGAFEDAIKAAVFGRIPKSDVLLMYGLSSNGFGYLLRAFVNVSTVYFSQMQDVVKVIRENSIREIFGSPAQIQGIVETCEAMNLRLKIEQISLGSAPLSPEVERRIKLRLRCDIVHVYNASEAVFIAISRGNLLHPQKTSGNYFIPIADIEIVDEKGVRLPTGGIGRIKITSRRVGAPFDGRLEYPIEHLENMSFISSDLGKIDEDGLLLLLGRADETINFGGAKFAPEIPEDIFKRHPLIADAGVVAVRSEKGEQEVYLALVAPSGIDLNLLSQWYAQNTSGELRSIRFDQCFVVDQIPRGFNGKVLRQQLRDKLTAVRLRIGQPRMR